MARKADWAFAFVFLPVDVKSLADWTAEADGRFFKAV